MSASRRTRTRTRRRAMLEREGQATGKTRAILVALGLCAAFTGGSLVARPRAARATGEGVSASLQGLTFAGTLQGASGTQELSFTFASGDATCVVAATVNPDAETKAFTVDLPIEKCPGAIWSGADVTVSVKVGDDLVVDERLVGSVPLAKFAERLGTADCPTGFSRDAADASAIACTRDVAPAGLVDEVVRVGSGPSAFWIDRFESSVITPDGAVADEGFTWAADGSLAGADDLPRAVSAEGRAPFAASWFQANLACRGAGKRLPTGAEFLAAAFGATGAACAAPGAAEPAATGATPACKSRAGALDLLGNVWEWTDDWSPGSRGLDALAGTWPDGSALLGVKDSAVTNAPGDASPSPIVAPAAIVRGGSYAMAADALSPLAYADLFAPTTRLAAIGFRCVIPR